MSIVDELLKLKGRKAAISPTDIVTFAKKNKKSALYAAFDSHGLWDDKVAADITRLEFSRKLIHRYKVHIVRADVEKVRVRGLVSLTEERETLPAKSYRLRSDIMKSPQLREAFARDCQRDIESLIRRYSELFTADDIDQLQRIGDRVLRMSGAIEEVGVAAQADV